MIPFSSPCAIATGVALAAGLAIAFAFIARARKSRYPALLYTSCAYIVVLHAVWIVGLLQGPLLASGFATLELLTFPWSFAVTTNMTMPGFDTLSALLVNYARFVLGFGGLQCVLLTLFVWELKLRPRRRRLRAASRSPRP